jgi:hypothetical protein
MTAYTIAAGSSCLPANNMAGIYRIEKRLDLADTGVNGVNGGAGVVQNDTVTLATIPAGTLVLGAYFSKITASSNLASLDIGDGDAATTYFSAIDLTSLTTKKGCSWSSTLSEGAPNTLAIAGQLGKYYAAAGVLKAKSNTNATCKTGVIVVGLLCIDVNATHTA